MKYQEIAILLPCHSLEDFPVHHDGPDAEGLLAGWSALWHPALITAAENMPTWHRLDDLPQELDAKLLIIPSVSMDDLPTGFVQRAKDAGCVVIRRQSDRGAILQTAFENLDGGDAGVDPEIAADFMALGYCYLQVELLTRQMRYSSNLDELHFQNLVVAGAQAAVSGDVVTADEKLRAAFNLLAEERDHYYPVDAFVLDLTLVASTTLGASLRQQLAEGTPTNLLITTAVLAQMKSQQPASFAAVQQGIDDGQVTLVSGVTTEQRWSLMSSEGVLQELQDATQASVTLLGKPIKVFGRRRFGPVASLPQILRKLGYEGAVHAGFEDGKLPGGSQFKVGWESQDGSAVDAIVKSPQDASQAGTYLKLAVKLGESMDTDHVATVCLAHWPGKASCWYRDLLRISKYTSALGKFMTLEAYFQETDHPVHNDCYEATQYASPYLQQAVIRGTEDPVSGTSRYWRRRLAAQASQALNSLAAWIRNDFTGDIDALRHAVEQSEEGVNANDLDAESEAALTAAVTQFADALPRQDSTAKAGYLIANPCSFVRRVGVELPELESPPSDEKPVYSSAAVDGRNLAVVDVPPMGFAWVTAGATTSRSTELMADDEEPILRNEFFEAVFSRETGGLQSLYEYKTRGNRLSQQLAFRLSRKPSTHAGYEPPDEGSYSRMVADRVEVTCRSATLGELESAGRLIDAESETLAEFKQRFQVWRGSRVILCDVELTPHVQPRSDPWKSYYGIRFAWGDQAADLYGAVNECRQQLRKKKIESPLYIDITGEKGSTTILTGGLPFHHRQGYDRLDTLLITRGERQRQFRFGIGVDLKQSLHEALGILLPPTMVPQVAAAPAPAESSWLFHVDARNVVATHWAPLIEDGRIVGFRARLLETAARKCRVLVSAFRPLSTATERDFRNEKLGELNVEEGKRRLEFEAHQWKEVAARWS